MLSRVLKKIPYRTYQFSNYVKNPTHISNDKRNNPSDRDGNNQQKVSNGDSGSSNDNTYMTNNVIILSRLTNGSADSDSFDSCGDGGSCGGGGCD